MHASWIGRHWRGELSLARSYWINCFLVLFVMWQAENVVRGLLHDGLYRYEVLFELAAYLLLLPLATWQLVGIWRAARGKRFWGFLARALVAVNVVGFPVILFVGAPALFHNLRFVAGITEPGTATVRILGDGREIEIAGKITLATADEFQATLAASPNVTLVRLKSHGGRLIGADRIFRQIQARGLNTYAAGQCASACGLIFLAGKERIAEPTALIGFHAAAADVGGLPGTDELSKPMFEKAGIDPGFTERALATPSGSMLTLTPFELKKYRVVTKIVGRD
jgi:hypothetical protein